MAKLMDTYCPRCSEPWEVLYITDEFSPRKRQEFYDGKGCPACEGREAPAPEDNLRGEAAGMLQELYGDDVDGIAADLEDFAYWGLI
jgi:hypothetical protein